MFYPKEIALFLRKQFRWVSLYIRTRLVYLRLRKDPARYDYTDKALEPVTEHEEERELFQTATAQTYLDTVHRNRSLSKGEKVL